MYVAFMLFAYFMFLFGLFYMARNVEQVAQHPMMEGLVDKVRYNLRDIPRVDYTQFMSDDSQSESQEVTPEASEEESDEPSVRKRRDRNPMGRILEEVDQL